MAVDDKAADEIAVDYARELAEQLSAVVAHKRHAQEKAGHLRRDHRQEARELG
jgi:hypothetical protein